MPSHDQEAVGYSGLTASSLAFTSLFINMWWWWPRCRTTPTPIQTLDAWTLSQMFVWMARFRVRTYRVAQMTMGPNRLCLCHRVI